MKSAPSEYRASTPKMSMSREREGDKVVVVVNINLSWRSARLEHGSTFPLTRLDRARAGHPLGNAAGVNKDILRRDAGLAQHNGREFAVFASAAGAIHDNLLRIHADR